MVDDLKRLPLFEFIALLEFALVIVGCTELCTFLCPKHAPVYNKYAAVHRPEKAPTEPTTANASRLVLKPRDGAEVGETNGG